MMVPDLYLNGSMIASTLVREALLHDNLTFMDRVINQRVISKTGFADN